MSNESPWLKLAERLGRSTATIEILVSSREYHHEIELIDYKDALIGRALRVAWAAGNVSMYARDLIMVASQGNPEAALELLNGVGYDYEQ